MDAHRPFINDGWLDGSSSILNPKLDINESVMDFISVKFAFECVTVHAIFFLITVPVSVLGSM